MTTRPSPDPAFAALVEALTQAEKVIRDEAHEEGTKETIGKWKYLHAEANKCNAALTLAAQPLREVAGMDKQFILEHERLIEKAAFPDKLEKPERTKLHNFCCKLFEIADMTEKP